MRQEWVVLQLWAARFLDLCFCCGPSFFCRTVAPVGTFRRQVGRSLACDSQLLVFWFPGLCGTPYARGNIWNVSSAPAKPSACSDRVLYTVAAIFRHSGDMAGHLNLAFWDAASGMPPLSMTSESGILSCHLMWRILRRKLRWQWLSISSAVENPGLAGGRETDKFHCTVDLQLNVSWLSEADAFPLSDILRSSYGARVFRSRWRWS